jgi:peptide chain release factor
MALPNLGVTPEKQAELLARLEALGAPESTLIETFVRSQGPGGQNVNKVSTAVRLQHGPTGLEVKAQKGRSQALNRFYARRLLAEKLEAHNLGNASPEQKKLAKIRKQKQRRQRRSSSGPSST